MSRLEGFNKAISSGNGAAAPSQPSGGAGVLAAVPAPVLRKFKKIVTRHEYASIVMIKIDCTFTEARKEELIRNTYVFEKTVDGIVLHEKTKRLNILFETSRQITGEILHTYNRKLVVFGEATLFRAAHEHHFDPLVLCKLVLSQLYGDGTESSDQMNKFLKEPKLIQDDCIRANVEYCKAKDKHGPMIAEMRRNNIAMFTILLKELCAAASIEFIYRIDDSQPEVQVLRPFLYKGLVIQWIDGQPMFADTDSHRALLRSKCIEYYRRFGCGIILYWVGMMADVISLPANTNRFAAIVDFPQAAEMTFLD